MLSQQGNRSIQLLLRYGVRTGQDDCSGCFDLIIVELTEVFHVDFHLAGIYNCNSESQRHLIVRNLFHSGNHVGQLAYTGRFDHNAIRMILFDHLGQRTTEVAN